MIKLCKAGWPARQPRVSCVFMYLFISVACQGVPKRPAAASAAADVALCGSRSRARGRGARHPPPAPLPRLRTWPSALPHRPLYSVRGM